MRYFLRCFAAAFILLAAAPAAAQQAAPTAQPAGEHSAAPAASPEFLRKSARLKQSIEAVLAGSDVTRGKVGILAVDAASGAVLYEQGSDISMNPASNAKLITAAATLDQFGPFYTVETRLLAENIRNDGTVPDGEIRGPLYIQGGGDAFLLYENLLGWADQLRRSGVKKISGGVVVDETLFAGEDLPPAFEQKDEDAAYRAPIGAFSVNFNGVSVVVEPAERAGQAPAWRMIPPNTHIKVVNQAKTVAGQRRNIRVSSETIPPDAQNPAGLGTRLTITGTIGLRARPFQSRRKRIDNPAQFAGSAFIQALHAVGIEAPDQVKTAPTPPNATVLVSHESKPLSFVELAMNKWSNNFMAEMLLRLMGTTAGEPSTWQASQAAVMAFLNQTGIDTTGLVLKNGSGLYDANRASARQIVALLRYMNGHRWAPEFKASLAISGSDGTLLRRLTEPSVQGRIRAKTGTLNQVAALSGYLRTDTGRLVAFSILFNDPPNFAWQYRPVQDRIARAIEGFDD